ncbi:putative protease [Propionibacterium phage PHL082M02]|uniref:Putative protease n=1 Tax=Propionibacterium phage PHL082M00 TaxID=1500808 RepID=A0A0E3DKA5_9CAUD|nr:putative protease [Propionibacterium phage PHL082M00]AII29097.1 putative protease [Propionibacterium phage PHL082M02]AII29189.1 putative protease [Propionibacterium phage PHL082M04]
MAGLVPHVTLFTPDYRRVAPINFFESLKLSLKWNGLSTLELVVSGDHSRLDGLTRPGARLVVDYGGGQIFSGPVRRVHGVGPWQSSRVTITCEDDIRMLWRMLLWPVPYRSSIIGMEWRANRDYAHYSGAAESVAKKALRDNSWRFPPDIFMVNDKSRGRYIKDFQARFHVFADKLLPVLSWARMTVTVKQFENVKQDQRGLLFDCVPAVTREHVLTAESGSIVSWEYVRDAPKATAVVVGGRGEGKDRLFCEDFDALAEDEWFDRVEVFKDARNTDSEHVHLIDEAELVLSESGATSGFKIELAESDVLRFGPGNLMPGDLIYVDVGSGPIAEIVRQIDVECVSPGDGWTKVTPIAGDYEDNPSALLARRVADLAAGVRDLQKF